MALIEIDEKLQVSDDLADLIIGLITLARTKIPKASIQSLILAKTRPGIDSEILSSTIISRFAEIGIPTGPLPDGSPNVMELYTNVISDEFTSIVQDDGRVDLMVDIGQQLVAFGANAGGPVTSYGSNIAPWIGTGTMS